MPGPVVHLCATVLCTHGGTAQPVASFPRVLVGGQPVVTQACAYTVAGCTLASVPSAPCVTAQWVLAALRVKAGGVPVVVQGSQAVCAPTGAPLNVLVTQPRVIAT
jgi:hypothetical protein